MRIFDGPPKVKIQIEVTGAQPEPQPSFLGSLLQAAAEAFGGSDADQGRAGMEGSPEAEGVYYGPPRSSPIRKKPCNCTGKREGAAQVSGVRKAR